MSENKPTITPTVRIIDNAAIRERNREEVQKSKKLRKKREKQRREKAARQARRDNQQVLAYAREYMAKNNVEKLPNSLGAKLAALQNDITVREIEQEQEKS